MPFGLFGHGPGAGRSQHIQELLRVFPNCRPINPDRSVFDLPVESQDVKLTTLRIILSPQFPSERPTFMVLVPVRNPSVDNAGRLHCRSLVEWGDQLGRTGLLDAVREALDILLRPSGGPNLMFPSQSHAAAGNSHRPAPPLANDVSSQPLANGGSGVGILGRGASSEPPAPDLSRVSAAELEKLLTDDDAFKAFLVKWVANSPAARALSEVQSQNLRLAAENLEAQESIDEARNHVAIVKSSEYSDAKRAFDGLYHRQEAVLSKLSPNVLLGRLRQESEKADNASRDVMDSYFSGQTPVELFVEEYSRKRTVYHSLDIKRQAAEHDALA